MCDSFVALPPATVGSRVLLGKSADCQVNEAHHLVRYPRRKHNPGAAFRATHLVLPQAAETHEVILSKSFWTWGAELGFNEHGVAIGNEAVFTTLQHEEKQDGLMVIDMLRLGLERGKTAREAVEAIGAVVEAFGQGGNCELAGNSHFDGSCLIADPDEAWVIETAGRSWVAKRITDSIGSISNVLTIGSDYELSSLKEPINWAGSYIDEEMTASVSARERQACSLNGLSSKRGQITVRSAFDVLRIHDDHYYPEAIEKYTNICVHAGSPKSAQWQATGAMVAELGHDGVMGWFTGTSSTCLSIFKPVFLGVDLPHTGIPNEQFDSQTLWWKHELLHRRAMMDFANIQPEIRKDFDALEAQFLADAPSVLKGSSLEKKAFMDDCFARAEQATSLWIDRLAGRSDLAIADADYAAMWEKYNSQSGIEFQPVLA